MKCLSILALLAVLACGLNGCASTETTAKGDPVPGEKTGGDDSRLQPGAGMGPNASVKW